MTSSLRFLRNWRLYFALRVVRSGAFRRILLLVTFPHHQRASLMGITISHRVRRDICEAARFNSRRFLMGVKCRSCQSREKHNQFTQWNTVAFATANVMVALRCLQGNQQVKTSLSWSSSKAHLIETSTFAICATSRFASIVPSTKTQDIATTVMQRSMGTQPINLRTTSESHIPVRLCRCVRGGETLVCCGPELQPRGRVQKSVRGYIRDGI